MKKFALALMCLVSVAFFASCTKPVENPEPSIAVMTGDNYIYDGQTINLFQEYNLGFRTASNSQTLKELAKFQLQTKFYEAGDEESSRPEVIADTTVTLTGTEYVYQEVEVFTWAQRDQVVGKIEFTAIVTDVDGKSNTKTISVNLNLAEQPLEVVDVDFYRLGDTQTGLSDYGLYWERNAKAPFAQIKPVQGAFLYIFDSSVWEEVVLPSQKIAKFADGATTAAVYNNVDVNANGTYNDVIGTYYNGEYHLINITSCVIGAQQSAGRPIHIYGYAK